MVYILAEEELKALRKHYFLRKNFRVSLFVSSKIRTHILRILKVTAKISFKLVSSVALIVRADTANSKFKTIFEMALEY
jgi:hypothetical protein